MTARIGAAAVLATAALAGTPSQALTPSYPPCTTANLRLALVRAEGAAGTQFISFRFTPRVFRCSIRGYPRVTLLGRRGRALPITVRHVRGVPVRTVTISRRQPGYFYLRHPSADPSTGALCRTRAYSFHVRPPGNTNALTVGAGRRRLLFCRAGARVSPVRNRL